MERLRAVVRGGGSIGMRHLEVLRGIGMDALSWPVRPRPAGATGHLPGGEAEGLAAYRDADLVVVATDTSRHVADALLALDHGAVRVLIEKPVAITAEDAAALSSHPRAGAIAIAAPLRAYEAFRAFAREIGKLPVPVYASIHCQSWLPDWRPTSDYRRSYSASASEGGVVRDLVHEIDYALYLFGAPDLVGAVLDGGPLEIESEQAASLLWRTERAAVAMRLDYISQPASRGAVVRSSAGTVEWDVMASTVSTVDAAGVRVTSSYDADRDRNEVMARQARAFLGLDSGDCAPATLADGIAAVRLCDLARSSDAHHRKVRQDG